MIISGLFMGASGYDYALLFTVLRTVLHPYFVALKKGLAALSLFLWFRWCFARFASHRVLLIG